MGNTSSRKFLRTHRSTESAVDSVAKLGVTHLPLFPSAVLGRMIALSPDGIPHVSAAGGAPMIAQVLEQVTPDHLAAALAHGSPVMLMFLDGDALRPVIIGVISSNPATKRRATTAMVDGHRVELTGQDEVVLTCGKASITLTREGRIILRGSHIASASSGLNRITGGSVQIN